MRDMNEPLTSTDPLIGPALEKGYEIAYKEEILRRTRMAMAAINRGDPFAVRRHLCAILETLGATI